jgi:predicted small lipoprotein YifL
MRGVKLAILLLLLQGCGLKGPLYLPTEQQKHETAERERLLREREARRAAEQQSLLPEAAPPLPGGPPQEQPGEPPP